ncbi:MAG: tetratricopeptide repeat protein [Anaerolineales bacterium]|nr:tetratricopeptide repeat protein [Anaerolineales bacterium]
MNPHLLILAIGIFYTLIFGALSLLRREGLSAQFAIEGSVITTMVVGIALLTNTVVDPLPFLIFIYLITMRGRLLVDLANALSSRGRQRDAIKLLQWAMRLLPDRSTRMVIQVNMGIVQLRRKNPDSAQELFDEVLKEMDAVGGLGIKYEAACRYNLGKALMQQDREVEAVRQFNETSIIYPTSIYARSSERILEQRRSRGRVKGDEQSDQGD